MFYNCNFCVLKTKRVTGHGWYCTHLSFSSTVPNQLALPLLPHMISYVAAQIPMQTNLLTRALFGQTSLDNGQIICPLPSHLLNRQGRWPLLPKNSPSSDQPTANNHRPSMVGVLTRARASITEKVHRQLFAWVIDSEHIGGTHVSPPWNRLSWLPCD